MGYKWASEHLKEGEEMTIQGERHVSGGHLYPHTDAAPVTKKEGRIVVLEEVHGIPEDSVTEKGQ